MTLDIARRKALADIASHHSLTQVNVPVCQAPGYGSDRDKRLSNQYFSPVCELPAGSSFPSAQRLGAAGVTDRSPRPFANDDFRAVRGIALACALALPIWLLILFAILGWGA